MEPIFELALSIKAAHRELERRMNEAMKPLGLTAVQADALVVIGAAEPLSLSDLGGMLVAESGNPSRLVDRMVERGLVDRKPAPDDRRRIELSLTPEGRKLRQRALVVRKAMLDVAHDLVGERDLMPALMLFRELLQHTEYADLVHRRRQLGDGEH